MYLLSYTKYKMDRKTETERESMTHLCPTHCHANGYILLIMESFVKYRRNVSNYKHHEDLNLMRETSYCYV